MVRSKVVKASETNDVPGQSFNACFFLDLKGYMVMQQLGMFHLIRDITKTARSKETKD